MIYLKVFPEHISYEAEVNVGGEEFKIPNVSYCDDIKDVHFNPYNLIKFYVGEISEPQTVSIYTDATNHLDVTVSEGNKWYSYLLPKDKGLYKISGNTVTKVMVKADITTSGTTIIPSSTVEASFKGSNTSNVTNMKMMFMNCSGLTSLDLSGWDTSDVTDMRLMFMNCNHLTSLDVSSFDTSNVTDINGMFGFCSGLTSLDLSNFDTSNVVGMNGTFNVCNKLTSLNLSNFNTSKVTDMAHMFQDCTSLTSLDLSGWDISNVTDTTLMFNSCDLLNTIRMKGCSLETINKIKAVKPSSAEIVTE